MRFTLTLVAVGTLVASSTPAQSLPAEAIVARDSAIIVFPADTFPQKGVADPVAKERNYALTLGTSNPDLFVSLGWSVQLQGDPFPRLIDILGRGKTWVCRPDGLTSACRDVRVAVGRIGDQPVMRIRDTALINDLFRLRPATADWTMQRPVMEGHTRESSAGGKIPVRYLDPGPAPVDARYRARVARQQQAVGRALDAMRSVGRVILSRWGEHYAELWIAAGDSTTLDVKESQCHVDVCGSFAHGLTGRWRVSDTSVAKVTASKSDYLPDARLHAVRVGRTRLTVDRIKGRRDWKVAEPAPSRLEISLVVTPPASRIEIDSLPAEIRRFDKVTVRFRVIAGDGAVLHGAPVTTLIGPVTEPRSGRIEEAADSVTFTAQETVTGERQRVLLTYGALRDSVTFWVAARKP